MNMSHKRSQHSAINSQASHTASHVGSRSGLFGASTSRRNVAFDSKLDKVQPKKASVQVLDDNGNDVTPRSLLSNEIVSQIGRGSKLGLNFPDSTSIGTPELFNQSMYGGQSTFQTSYAAGFSKSIMSSMMGSSYASLDSVIDEISEPSHGHAFSGIQEIEHKRTKVKENLTHSDLKKKITITLEETDTIWHLDIPGVSLSDTSEQASEIREKNKRYTQLCANRAGNDMFVQRGVQTFNNAPKTKEIQTQHVGTKEVGCMATNYDMYDTFNSPEPQVEEDAGDDDIFGGAPSIQQQQEQQVAPGANTASIINSMTGSFANKSMSRLSESVRSFTTTTSSLSLAPNGNSAESEELDSVALSELTSQFNKLLKSDELKEHLFVMERTVVQNFYHHRQATYRGLEELNLTPTVKTNENRKEIKMVPTKIGPNLSRLWAYESPKTRGMGVTCMVWNKENQDLIGVGYGENGLGCDGKGFVCVWSIKNPEFPERIYSTESIVTAIDFSMSQPNFLAIGLYNGTIAVYNIRSATDESVLDSIDSIGKHSAPVSQLKWVERDKGTGEEKGEVLISASSDGRVTQWSIRKGFEFLDIMKMKRTIATKQSANQSKKTGGESGGKKSDALISRFAACMCFDFHNIDGNIYIAGTDEGYVHRCSCSYNEQFLETYSGHKGAVYRTLWSPHDPDMFLSCSADWTIRLWHVDKLNPLLTCQASTKAIVDIDWSPTSAVMFAAITEQQIEIWDLSISTLDPLLVYPPVTKIKMTSVKFSLNSEALLVGDCEGHVAIYQIKELNLRINDKNKNEGWLARIVDSTMSQTADDISSEESESKPNSADEADR